MRVWRQWEDPVAAWLSGMMKGSRYHDSVRSPHWEGQLGLEEQRLL